ncbi:MAG: citrate synthase [Alphaproteobacteria bacterium]|jgi:citrate synthase
MADKAEKPVTRIGSAHARTDVLTMRGKDTLEEIVGVRSFSETFFFIVTGRMPEDGQTRCFDACLNVLMDHGVTPGALVARLVEGQVPDDIQVPVAAGLLTVGNRHVGTMAGAGRLLAEALSGTESLADWAARTASEHRAQKKRVPGFGHPHYAPDDPRTQRLFQVAEEAGCAGRGIEAIKALGAAVDAGMGRHLTLNVTGGMAAVLTEIGFPVEAMRGVAVVGRAAGLVGHIIEEKQNSLAEPLIRYADREFSVGD